jgi:hypothetical protein
MIIRLSLIILLFTQVSLRGQAISERPVSFFAEEITLEINDSTVSVSGMYCFRNNSDKEGYFPLAFPFYIDSLCDYPYHIEVYLLDNDVNVPLDFSRIGNTDKIRFGLPLEPDEEIVWYLEYKQKIRSNRAVYVLKSTGLWGEPLEWATYKFIVPPNFTITDVWPVPDVNNIINKKQFYICNKENFMPERDMEIKWEVAK